MGSLKTTANGFQNAYGEPGAAIPPYGLRAIRWRLLLIVLALCVAVAAPVLQFRLMAPDLPWPSSDLVPVALGVQATLQGRDAYSVEVTREIQTAFYGRPLTAADHKDEQHFAYPAYAAVVLAPLAAFAWTRSELLFLVLMPPLTAASVLLWLHVTGIKLRGGRLVVMVILTLASWPVMWSLRLCQITLLVAFLLAAGCWLLKIRQAIAAGLLLSLTTIKPQTAGPLLIWLLAWACVQRRWSFAVSLLGGTSTLLLLTAWIAPGWLPRWLATAAEYARYTRISPMLQYVFGYWLGGAIMLGIAAGGCLVLWRMRRCSVESAEFGVAVSLVLALTVCIFPTAAGMTYNDVVLLPALLILIHCVKSGHAARAAKWISLRMLLASFVAVPLQVAAQLLWGYTKTRTVLVLVPLLLLPACATVALALYSKELRFTPSFDRATTS